MILKAGKQSGSVAVLLLAVSGLLSHAQIALPRINSVLGNAGQALAPGGLVIIRGSGFGTKPTVTFNGIAVFVSFAADQLIDIQVPYNLQPGSYNLVVAGPGGNSNPFAVNVVPLSPAINPSLNNVTDAAFYSPPGVVVTAGNPVMPGDRARFFANSLGPVSPPATPPQLLIDGQDTPILASVGAPYAFGPSGALTVDITRIDFQVPPLPSGMHKLAIVEAGLSSNVVNLPVLSNGIILSQSGLTLNAVEGGPAPAGQTFTVLSGVGTINFTTAASTFSGGSWLSVSPANGIAQFGQTGVAIQVKADPTGLVSGSYYGQVRISSSDAKNSPQVLTIVLVVAPRNTDLGIAINPTGLVFRGAVGGSDPAAQTVNVTNPTAAALTVAAAVAPGNGPFKVTPSTGTVSPGQTISFNVQASLVGLAAGVYNRTLTLTLADGSSRTVALQLIVAPAGTGNVVGAGESMAQASSGCKASKLLPVFTLLGNNFNVPAAWPTPIEVTVTDDCGASLISGTTTLSFSNGDPPLTMSSLRNGKWTATWPPVNPRSSNTAIAVQALQQESGLTGTATITGGVRPNASVPIISHGGVVETASYSGGPAGGGLIAIFGSQLSDGQANAMTLPLGTQLLSTSALISGQSIPLVFTSGGQINALLPYSLPVDTRQQMVILRGNAYSVPELVPIGVARPAVFTTNASGSGQGHIYKIDAAGGQTLADGSAPAQAGDYLVIYCAGLGAVNPAIDAGVPAPFDHLTNTVNPVNVTIGGQTINTLFAGLTPGFTGLYQINIQVPAGLPTNDTTQVTLTVADQTSVAVNVAIRQTQ